MNVATSDEKSKSLGLIVDISASFCFEGTKDEILSLLSKKIDVISKETELADPAFILCGGFFSFK